VASDVLELHRHAAAFFSEMSNFADITIARVGQDGGWYGRGRWY
jgi:hypothetical protein